MKRSLDRRPGCKSPTSPTCQSAVSQTWSCSLFPVSFCVSSLSSICCPQFWPKYMSSKPNLGFRDWSQNIWGGWAKHGADPLSVRGAFFILTCQCFLFLQIEIQKKFCQESFFHLNLSVHTSTFYLRTSLQFCTLSLQILILLTDRHSENAASTPRVKNLHFQLRTHWL